MEEHDRVEESTTVVAASVEGQPVNIGGRIIAGGAWRLLSYGLATAVAVLATAVVSRAVGPVGFAEYTTALSLIAIAVGLSDFGLLALGVREYTAWEGEERERRFRALITVRLLLATTAAVAVIAIASASGFSGGALIGFMIATVGLVIGALYTSYTVALQATYRLSELALFDGIRQISWSGLSIIAALATASVGAVIASLLPSALIVAVLCGIVVSRLISIRPSWDPGMMRVLMASVGAYAVAAAVGSVYGFLAQVASNAVLNGYESGQFALAFRIYAVLFAAGVMVLTGTFPLLVSSADSDWRRFVFAARRMIQTALIAGGLCAVGLLGASGAIADVLGGAEYRDAVELIEIIGFALPATFLLTAGSYVLLATKRYRQLITVSIVGATLSILVTVLLASVWNGVGAAAGIVVGEFVLAAGYTSVILRTDRRMLPATRWLGGFLLVVAISCLVRLVGLPSLITGVVAVALYAALLVAFRLVPPELLQPLRQLGRSQRPSADDG